MTRDWPEDALAFEESVSAALKARGGIEFTRQCEADPRRRETELRPVVESLGVGDIDFSGGEIEAAATALGAKAAGQVVAPWPLVAQLAAPRDQVAKIGAAYLVTGTPRRIPHLDLVDDAVVIDVREGTCRRVEPAGPLSGMPLDPFGVPCRLGEEIVDLPSDTVVGSVVLTAFWVLGAIETVVSLATAYTVEREQFSRPIGTFGAIQWRLADLARGRSALSEIAAFTLGKMLDRSATLADAWALRLTMIESAESVLANGHQVMGAIGLCEEHDITVIDRHLQGQLRRPLGRTATNSLLAEKVAVEGFDLVYPLEPSAAGTGTH